MSVVRARKKPVEIEAIQLTGDNWDEAAAFAAPHVVGSPDDAFITEVYVYTLEGAMTAHVDDWIIKGVAGEFYPCKPDIFDATYEIIE